MLSVCTAAMKDAILWFREQSQKLCQQQSNARGAAVALKMCVRALTCKQDSVIVILAPDLNRNRTVQYLDDQQMPQMGRYMVIVLWDNRT